MSLTVESITSAVVETSNRMAAAGCRVDGAYAMFRAAVIEFGEHSRQARQHRSVAIHHYSAYLDAAGAHAVALREQIRLTTVLGRSGDPHAPSGATAPSARPYTDPAKHSAPTVADGPPAVGEDGQPYDPKVTVTRRNGT